MTDQTTRGSALTWAAGLAVATGAGVATAHGLFQVAAAAGVPGGVAWLYPLITDGLALVAYAATARLTASRPRRYAAAIVVLAAGLSGLAQAVYLAGAIHRGHTAPVGLRCGVGAWPALAAAIAAQLLHLIHPHGGVDQPEASTAPASNTASYNAPSNSGPSNAPASNWTYNPSTPTASNDASNPAVQPRPPGQRPTSPDRPGESVRVDAPQPELDTLANAADAGSARDRARTAALAYRDRHAALPTVAELAEITGASHGTAGNALKDVRAAHPALHLISTKPSNDTTKTTNS